MNNKTPNPAEMEGILQSLRAYRSQQKKGGVEERRHTRKEEMAISDERTVENSFIDLEPAKMTITMVLPNPETCDKDDKVYFKWS